MLSESRRKLTRSATPNQRTPRAASAAPAGLFKRPTHAVEELHQIAATRTERRLFVQVDFRREMRPIAFVDPGAFLGTDPEALLSVRPSLAMKRDDTASPCIPSVNAGR